MLVEETRRCLPDGHEISDRIEPKWSIDFDRNMQKSKEGRYHYHMIIERPLEWCLDDFTHLIETEWVKTQFGHRQLHLDKFIDFGWVHYITKFHSKSDLVDWENVHIVR